MESGSDLFLINTNATKNNTKVIIFGTNGMLGRYLAQYLMQKYKVISVTRKECDAMTCDSIQLAKLLCKYGIDKDTVVINTIGIIPQASKNHSITDRMYIQVNSVFPNVLSLICSIYNANMIHSTTDCVYDGLKGNYIETDPHSPVNLYGTTKSIGESAYCSIIRTSIIGEELVNKRSLLEWVKSNKNKEIDGYVNHYWNGITCLQYAKIVDTIISKCDFWIGVRHFFSPESVSKYELVNMINDVYKLNIKVNIHNDNIKCDRTLSTMYKKKINIPSLRIQIEELSKFNLV